MPNKAKPILPKAIESKCGRWMEGKMVFLPGEICRGHRETDNLSREVQLSRQKSAEAIVPVTGKGQTRSEGLTWRVRERHEDSRKPRQGPATGRKR